MRLAGGLDCTTCSPSTDILEAAAQEALAGQAWVALVPADTANCLLPHESLANKLQSAGAAGELCWPVLLATQMQDVVWLGACAFFYELMYRSLGTQTPRLGLLGVCSLLVRVDT